MILVIIDRVYMALFAALEQTHCVHVRVLLLRFCFLFLFFLNIHGSGALAGLFESYTAGAT